jgi:hypothetical protein
MPHLPKSSHQPLSHINKTLTTAAGDEQLCQEHDLNSRHPLSLSLMYISLPIHLLLFPDLTQSSYVGFNGGNKGAKEERACRSVKKFNYISESRSTILSKYNYNFLDIIMELSVQY